MAFLAAESICSGDTGRTYTIIRALGHGAFGEVLLVQDAASRRHYAAKQLYMRDPGEELPLSIIREITALQQLHHPNVIELLDTAIDGPCMYLIQELCKTDVAAVLIAANRHMPPGVAKAIMQQLLQALAACHDRGLMHRDVKLSNLLVTANGVLKLGDFGLTRSYRLTDCQQQQGCSHAATPLHQGQQQQHKMCSQLQQEHQSIADKLQRQLCLLTPGHHHHPHHHQQQQQQKQQQKQQQQKQKPSRPPQLQLSGCFTTAQGTRWYRAPEVLFGSRDYGPAVDIWSAAMVFAEILGLSPLIPGQSDIDQLARMQQTLGSITTQDWPEVEQLPDWHKIRFGHSPGQPLAELLPDAPALALDLLQGMIAYNPSRRLTAAAALQHRWFREGPAAAGPAQVAEVIDNILGQAVPVMPPCQASFTWSDTADSDSDDGGSVVK